MQSSTQEKKFTDKFSPMRAGGKISENFFQAKIFGGMVHVFHFVINICLQNTVVDESQAKTVSFLFSLLIQAVKRLSQSENDSPVIDEDQLCGLLEQVVDKWLVEKLFLNDQWLVNVGHEDHSVKQKKTSRRKSRGSSQAQTSIDYLCSSEIVELLRVAVESCSKFQISPVVRLAVMRMFDGSKILLGKAQRDGTLGRVCTCVYMYIVYECLCGCVSKRVNVCLPACMS